MPLSPQAVRAIVIRRSKARKAGNQPSNQISKPREDRQGMHPLLLERCIAAAGFDQNERFS